jgi:hypothetical protein
VVVLGYIFLVYQVGGYNAALYKVFLVDVVGIGCLII